MTSAGLFEFSLLIVALILGWIFAVQPAENVSLDWKALLIGIVGAVPLFLAFLGIEQLPIEPVQKIQEAVLDSLGRFLAGSTHLELILLATLAGVGEEVLFRGFLLPWVESLGGYWWGLGISSLLFGIMHAVTWTYTIFASLAGAYFGVMLDISGERNLLAPIAAHAFYDYLAFLVIIHDVKKSEREYDEEESDDDFESDAFPF